MKVKRTSIIYRAMFLFAIAAIIIAVLGGRFLYVQLSKEVNGVDLEALANERWSNEEPLHGERGTIYASNGDPVAEEVTSYTAYAILDESYGDYVEDPERTANELAPYIDMEQNRLTELLNSDLFQVELGSGARQLSFEEMEEIEALDLDGVHFRHEPKRFYPKQVFASHLLGYVDRGSNEAVMGLEAAFEQELSGNEGSLSFQTARNGVPLPGEHEELQEAYNGNDIHLTINSNIQLALEQSLSTVEEEYEPERMIGIIANANTGEILGMSNRPSFNPNDYENITNYTNFAVSDHFEPGSTMKMFTMAGAIEEGAYDGDEVFESGSYDTGYDTVVNDHNQGEGWGEITYDEAMERSANTGFAKLVNEKLGAESLYEYLGHFGFGTQTGIELPNEAQGMIANSKLDAIYSGFGQTSAVTPIQQVQAATAIANDGKMMKPYLIDRSVNPNVDETTYSGEPEVVGEPISEDTAEEVLGQLTDVVYGENGTGQNFQVDGVEIAGKTGTAQIPSDEGYLSGRNQNIFSFLGMAPADDPEIVMYVAVDRPNTPDDEPGMQPVSTIFNTVMQQSMQYLNLTSDESLPSESARTDDIYLEDGTGMPTDQAVETFESQNVDPFIVGDGSHIESQYPLAGEEVIAGEKIFLVSSDMWEMPDMSGWSARDVVKFSAATGVNVEHEGSGYVSGQSVDPGTPMGAPESISVKFSHPDQADGEENVEEQVGEENE
ncbi:penicillin-binding protein 2B [Geomicrobium halophilum]|uniref:Penicillin-binding protein 2B n=1 Tax=Geomicrobium halophilum TaxID=549000 RepID=A0A841PKU2_9BACL|nr:penicillin-binding protein [Geomicrobium halophilum]MBB6449390.1 penicillin-binding protein 2B [Geomicrobium halophilum]